MKSLFLVALFNFRLSGYLGRGIRLSDTLFLTNEPSQIHPLLSRRFEGLAGVMETETLRNANAVIYAITEHQSETLTEDQAVCFLGRQLGLVQLFLMSLWLVKDNSVNIELGFLEHPYGNPFGSFVTSNFRAIRFCEASGVITDCEFSEAEARVARDFYKLFEANAIQLTENNRAYVLPTDFTRFDRAFYFAQAARSAGDLGIKIANYVTCFECLFCTDAAELAHKLSERVALFSDVSPDERRNIFKAAKAAYTVRSKTVHGDTLPKKLVEEIPNIATQCDNILRDTIKRILSNHTLFEIFIGPTQALEDHMNDLVFGPRDTTMRETSSG